jgi:hypothetical protein
MRVFSHMIRDRGQLSVYLRLLDSAVLAEQLITASAFRVLFAVHPDLDRLLAELLPFAERMLLQDGEFYPFANSMSLVGEIRDIAGWDGIEHPSSSDLIKLLVDGSQRQAEQGIIRACGLCPDVRVRKSEDAPMTDAIIILVLGVSTLRAEFAQKQGLDKFIARARYSSQFPSLRSGWNTSRLRKSSQVWCRHGSPDARSGHSSAAPA